MNKETHPVSGLMGRIQKAERGQKLAIICTGALMVMGLFAFALSCRSYFKPSDPPPAPLIAEGPPVHILLSSGQSELTFATGYGGVWRNADPESGGRRFGPGELTLAATEEGLSKDGKVLDSSDVYFLPHDGFFEFQEHTYRGELQVQIASDGGLMAFEVLHLEDYIRGVLPAEIYPDWPMDTIVAQAIAVRTFALNMVNDPQTRPWLTTLDLAYRGAGYETERTDKAVLLSAGRVLTYEGELFPAFFHSTCGGQTASSLSVFGAHGIAPLRSVRCGWCIHSRYAHWNVSFSLEDISRKLFPGAAKKIESIETTSYDEGGRPEFILINGEEKLRSSEFRLTMGTMQLKSTRFDVKIADGKAHFSGSGFGHGVGLCQWGAHGMGLVDYGWEAILERYYPGSKVQSVEEFR